jgi:hypothetical protein
MTLVLSNSEPKGLEAKAWDVIDGEHRVYLGDYEIPIEDFLILTKYVLINTDLHPNDPRLEFLEEIKKLEVVKGFNPGKERLWLKE